MKKSLLGYITAGVFVTFALSVQAEVFKYPTIEKDRPGGFTLTPMIGQYYYDSDLGLDDDGYAGIGVGYRFSAPYMLEFVYLNGDVQTDAGIDQGDLEQYRLELLYDLGDSGKWSPYFALGAASTEFGDNNPVIDDEGAITIGFGTRYNFTQRVALRGDARYIRGVGDNKAGDYTLGLGLQFFVGKVNKPESALASVVEEPAPVVPTFAELCAEVGGTVEAASCVKKSLSTERAELNVQFETNSAKVIPSYLTEIERLANFMQTYPTPIADIEGHTDSRGASEYNQGLSQRRANEVARLLSEKYGIAASRLTAAGYGETRPIETNDTSAGRAKNRRVKAFISVEIEETINLNVK